jgi:hypothetical protein
MGRSVVVQNATLKKPYVGTKTIVKRGSRVETKTEKSNAAALWVTYADGTLKVRYFDKRKPLTAWVKTAQTLKALGVITLFTVFPVDAAPEGCRYITH